MDKQRNEKIIRQVKRDRAARRQAEIDLQLPKVHAKVIDKSKKKLMQKTRQTLRNWDD